MFTFRISFPFLTKLVHHFLVTRLMCSSCDCVCLFVFSFFLLYSIFHRSETFVAVFFFFCSVQLRAHKLWLHLILKSYSFIVNNVVVSNIYFFFLLVRLEIVKFKTRIVRHAYERLKWIEKKKLNVIIRLRCIYYSSC